MARYSVEISYYGSTTVDVEADSKEEAAVLAGDYFESDSIQGEIDGVYLIEEDEEESEEDEE